MYAFSGGYDSSICACAFGIIGSTMAITAASHDDDDRRADDRDSLALIGLPRLLRRINKPTVGLFLRFLYRLLHRR